MFVRRVEALKLVLALGRAKQARGALDVAVGSALPGGTKGGKGTQDGIKLKGTNEHLPVIDEPFFADALVLGGVGEELPKVRIARLPQRIVPSTSPCSAPVGAEGSSRGEGGDRVCLVLPLSPGCGFREVCAEGFADAGPLGVAKHIDQIQIGRDKRLERAVGRQGFNGAAPEAETLTSTWQADAPVMHAQDLGAKGDLVLIDEPA